MHACGQREIFLAYPPTAPRTVVVYIDGHNAEVQGRGNFCLKFTRGSWVTLRVVLHVPTILKGLISAEKFENCMFKMELEKGKFVINKGKMYVGRAKKYA